MIASVPDLCILLTSKAQWCRVLPYHDCIQILIVKSYLIRNRLIISNDFMMRGSYHNTNSACVGEEHNLVLQLD